MKNHRKKKAVLIPLVILGVAVCVSLLGMVVMQLWNHLLPELFNFPVITFWQALGLLVLCKILFGSFGPGRRCGGPPWARRMHAMKHMDPDQRERFRAEMEERWCGFRKKFYGERDDAAGSGPGEEQRG